MEGYEGVNLFPSFHVAFLVFSMGGEGDMKVLRAAEWDETIV